MKIPLPLENLCIAIYFRIILSAFVRKRVLIHLFQDFRRTFKTLGGQLKIIEEIRDRIQHHALHDVSSVHYDRYDYNEEKLEAFLKWENKLKEIMDNN